MNSIGKTYTIFAGTDSVRDSRGLYQILFDGERAEIVNTVRTYNSGYLTVSKNGNRLYVVSEGMSFHGKASGGVISYDISREEPEQLNWVFSGGQRPCFLSLDPQNCRLAAANFYGGSISVFGIKEDGSIGERAAFIQEKALPGRLNGMHGLAWLPDGRLAAVYLGTGSVIVYGGSTFEEQCRFDLPEEVFPRHIAASPDGKTLYLMLQEPAGIMVLREETGRLSCVQNMPLFGNVPEKAGLGAAVILSPDGQRLYASSRKGHAVSVFRVDPSTGLLSQPVVQKLDIRMPRDIKLTPDEKYLVVTGQASDNIAVYAIDKDTDRIEPGIVIQNVTSPGCIAIK